MLVNATFLAFQRQLSTADNQQLFVRGWSWV